MSRWRSFLVESLLLAVAEAGAAAAALAATRHGVTPVSPRARRTVPCRS